jgi:hypothetical protein
MRQLLAAALLVSVAQCAFADPHTDYLLYCRGCHLANGEGVPPDVPTLHELGRLVVSEEGRDYIIRVPGVSQTAMDDEQLAAVLNWILTEFNADDLPDEFRPYSAVEVGEARQKVLADPLKARAALIAD